MKSFSCFKNQLYKIFHKSFKKINSILLINLLNQINYNKSQINVNLNNLKEFNSPLKNILTGYLNFLKMLVLFYICNIITQIEIIILMFFSNNVKFFLFIL